jgi:neuronal guanine nucleotide exchange factor
MLPMQRITRLPLLIDAVLTRLDQTDDEYTTCQLALATLNKVSLSCRVISADEYGTYKLVMLS